MLWGLLTSRVGVYHALPRLAPLCDPSLQPACTVGSRFHEPFPPNFLDARGGPSHLGTISILLSILIMTSRCTAPLDHPLHPQAAPICSSMPPGGAVWGTGKL
jgi:hypothetical protein